MTIVITKITKDDNHISGDLEKQVYEQIQQYLENLGYKASVKFIGRVLYGEKDGTKLG